MSNAVRTRAGSRSPTGPIVATRRVPPDLPGISSTRERTDPEIASAVSTASAKVAAAPATTNRGRFVSPLSTGRVQGSQILREDSGGAGLMHQLVAGGGVEAAGIALAVAVVVEVLSRWSATIPSASVVLPLRVRSPRRPRAATQVRQA